MRRIGMLSTRWLLARISVIAASALFGGCGGKSALYIGGADDESASSAGGRGGDGGSYGTSGNTSFAGTAGTAGAAGTSGSGGNVGAGGTGPVLGAGFPICPGYDEPQICSAEEAECLDVAPCESGGCRRIRSICTSGFWTPDGGTACGFACSDGPPPTTCEIDEIGGIFEASYIKQAGDCELDDRLGGPATLVSGMVGTETGFLTVEATEVSSDRCNLSYSLAYEQETDSVRWSFWLVQLDEEGSALQGSAKVVMTTGLSTCSNSYLVRFDQRP